ncbi:hypothetical protein GCM10011369_05960 [Neiella marina]|uniref:Ribonuclease H1 N-terminal domain-containing protein n=1 Tax=Neiella marina TaxID=508461 RepID=A0A8J2U2I9_9GAMM|nr:hypothetical protein GCM10011369_05960 [Neiella marina]
MQSKCTSYENNDHPKKWYVVFLGNKPGIYNSYRNVMKYITGYQMPSWKSYDTYEEAEDAFERYCEIRDVTSKKTYVWGAGLTPPRSLRTSD